MTRILIASVINQDPEILEVALRSWKKQSTDAKLDFCFILDVSDKRMHENRALIDRVFDDARVMQSAPKPAEAIYGAAEDSHSWNIPTFGWLAREKDRLLDLARTERYDAIWLVDSDLICASTTLSSLLATEKHIVSAVFWTKWHLQSPPLPQTWLAHPYEFQGMGMESPEFMRRLLNRDLVQVAGLGACTLISYAALARGVSFAPMQGLPTHGMWQGEDRHFCVRARNLHISMWADAWSQVWHCYRPSDKASLSQRALELSWATKQDPPAFGDLVSIIIEPVEEPKAAGHKEHLRGRFGALDIAPELEHALEEMRAGESRFVEVRFPIWHPIAEYRGATRLLHVRLLDVRPYTLAPALDDFHDVHKEGVRALIEPFAEVS